MVPLIKQSIIFSILSFDQTQCITIKFLERIVVKAEAFFFEYWHAWLQVTFQFQNCEISPKFFCMFGTSEPQLKSLGLGLTYCYAVS